ncbi:PTS glucitol/sorbitol transporter subunit IIA [Staphylococcus sp. ACRSN]|uniref:PTS glucitol/sorbitol transporter subunit IIA n=1 Tax=Staphylococcus sp. ACRSN TaxID=2918214 RepID=UPI001EF17966|nr:PTS glucitol/sorbitol transporter subunit IIA [Staphylococcus sp. ACRSN]MCG7337823.1 PTS glucitol/sorbitol transporter subunit IIA [Staphylococcus sp. ACRSN]
MYKTIVKDVGSEASAFSEENMIILFGDNAPDELIDYCYIIEINSIEGEITESQKVLIGDKTFEITKVGASVQKNLADLGHITLKFDGSTKAEQSGTLYLEAADVPNIEVGTELKIV